MADPNAHLRGNNGVSRGPATDKFVRAAFIRLYTKQSSEHSLDQLALAAHGRAIAGDVAAMSFIRDTIDGKPAQVITGPDGGPISMEFRTFYEPLLAGSGPTIEHEPAQIGPQSSQEAPQGPENAGG
jgi:hypothetical protein